MQRSSKTKDVGLERSLLSVIKKMSVLVFTIFFLNVAQAEGLTHTEKYIRDYANANQQSVLKLIEKLVNINSGTANIAGVHQVGEMLRPQFEQLGFTTRWVEEPVEFHRAGTLIAERKGREGKRLLLIGHLDTVFSAESSFQKFKLQKDIATGPGIIDDKGSVVVMLYALKALNAVHALNNKTITVVLTGDEEDSGKPTTISRQPLIAVAKQSDIALDFEAGSSINTAVVARRGIAHWTISALGHGMHSGKIFQNNAGNGAIFELSRILNSMREKLSQERYLTFNPGIILGGALTNFDKLTSEATVFGKDNVIAQQAMAKGDLRFISEAQKINAEKNIQMIVDQHLVGTTARIDFFDGAPAMPLTAANEALLQQYSLVSQNLGYGAVKSIDPGERGAADISHVADIVSANLAGLGAIGKGEHSDGETLDIRLLPVQISRAAILIYNLTN